MYIFIVNPNARSGLGASVWTQIEAVLKERKIVYNVLFTQYRYHAVRLARQATSDGLAHTLIALGGDGTINEVMNGIADFSKTTFGCIPVGSGNDFARFFGHSSDPVQALDAILNPKRYARVNIGLLSYQTHEHRFAVSAGMGFDAGVCHQAVHSKIKPVLNRLHLGRLTYLIIALKQMILLRPADMELLLDGRRKIFRHSCMFAAIMNHPFEGGGFKFCPNASPSDNLLDVIVVSGISKLKALLLLPTALFGLHTRFRGVHIYSCKTVRLVSKKALPVHTDGEPVCPQKSVQAALIPEKLRVIVP